MIKKTEKSLATTNDINAFKDDALAQKGKTKHTVETDWPVKEIAPNKKKRKKIKVAIMEGTTMTNQSYLNSEKPLAVVASNLNMHGYDLAKQFAEHGYDLIVVAGNPSIIEEAQDFKELGVNAVSFQLDLSTSEGVEQLYRRIIATGRPVEAMVINTGLSTNFTNETNLAKKILKDMADRGHGRILFASTENQEDTSPIYEAIFKEAKGSGVTVAAVKSGENELYFLKEGYFLN